ncbi:SRPBCC domain-containing protein [Emticicia agri]|uniref:ATPase n=1 Tax=Emticicia agri TaxID=2492393 RepID=A0A4Q5LWX1_9BACT|nr:SRPBCC domain-containing protein [Emticicia agri]RYU94248.1 ATPase [Emticicia agri]
MITHNNTQVIAEPGKQELFIIREFKAPREKVFKAFTDPDILIKFFAPFGNTMHFNHHDYKSGGSYSWYNKNAEGKIVCTFAGTIHELTAPERVIQTSEFMEMPERGHAVMEAMFFEELENGRTKLTIHDVCFSVADRDAMINSGMEHGLVDIFNQLDALLN